MLAGDVGPDPSLHSETGDEESAANSLLWEEVEIKQICVWPVPSIGFVLSQLEICLEGLLRLEMSLKHRRKVSVGCWLGEPWRNFKPSKTPLVFLLLSPKHISNRNGASNTHQRQPRNREAVSEMRKCLSSGSKPAAGGGTKNGSPNPSPPGQQSQSTDVDPSRVGQAELGTHLRSSNQTHLKWKNVFNFLQMNSSL